MDWGDAARHVYVGELVSGRFVESDSSAGTVMLASGDSISKIRIYGLVVSDDLVVDDGTGSVLVRSFDKSFAVQIGSPVLVIGRPRVYNGDWYVVAEVVKIIDSKWMEWARKSNPPKIQAAASTSTTGPLDVVRALDAGDGADYNEVVTKLGAGGEETIIHMLAMGEVFEIRPGRLKILE
ncbi:hypothetical protein J4219_03095 [Candidatus Woesearchaeota archaeon]|nr:hypothetical protein [Candidatus Woesearchaeota archaeon]